MSEEPSKSIVIVGLGNPGVAYDFTRHNIGHDVVCAFAKDQGWNFKKSLRLSGSVAKGSFQGVDTTLLLPSTYMNNSGQAVKKCLEYYKLGVDSLLVIADDIFIPFGRLRLREKGSARGHNGLKSVEQHVGTSEYNRIRFGIGNVHTSSLEEYVLSKFNRVEMKQISEIINHAIAVIDYWIKGDKGRAIKHAASLVPVKLGEE